MGRQGGENGPCTSFAIARCQQPTVIFIDENDSLLSQQGDGEHESSRRIKTEFLVPLVGTALSSEDCMLVVGSTNCSQEIMRLREEAGEKALHSPPRSHSGGRYY